jgi:hypothetical protein
MSNQSGSLRPSALAVSGGLWLESGANRPHSDPDDVSFGISFY